jgi:hypothetical protein
VRPPNSLVIIVAVLALIALIRAVAEFRMAGLFAFGQLIMSPAILVMGMMLDPKPSQGFKASLLYPAAPTRRKIIILTLSLSALLLGISALFGIGWVVRQ